MTSLVQHAIDLHGMFESACFGGNVHLARQLLTYSPASNNREFLSGFLLTACVRYERGVNDAVILWLAETVGAQSVGAVKWNAGDEFDAYTRQFKLAVRLAHLPPASLNEVLRALTPG